MEVDVHVGSSSIADNIVGVCRSYSKAFICNLGMLYEPAIVLLLFWA